MGLMRPTTRNKDYVGANKRWALRVPLNIGEWLAAGLAF